MYLAYFDESGDSGVGARSPTQFFVLACVLMHERVWLENLNKLARFRRRVRQAYGIPMNAELKANHIRRGSGALTNLRWSPDRRGRMFRFLLRLPSHLKSKVFAVAVEKNRLQAGRDSREVAWQYALQRVDRFCRETDDLSCLFPDEGHSYFIKRMVRKLRRHQIIQGRFGGLLDIKAERIVEDPNDRSSTDSYFIQLADWAAYAAHRSRHVSPGHPAFSAAWDGLGDACLTEVNKVRGGPPGIVRYP